eukprot:Rhum_TRINITY_DN15169_c3_g1::Rhum_TRINITY_DN15169_c3_g1_i6::g.139649::m.139649
MRRAWVIVAACGVAAATCSRDLQSYDDPATAVKYAGAGSLELSATTQMYTQPVTSGRPDEATFYVRSGHVNSQVFVAFWPTGIGGVQVAHSLNGKFLVKEAANWNEVASTTTDIFEKVTVSFYWEAGLFVACLNDNKCHTGTLAMSGVLYVDFELVGGSTPAYIDELELGCRPTYALSPDTCVDGVSAVTVQVSKGSKPLSVNDKVAIVESTDCTDAETKCDLLNSCSTSATLTLTGENLHWAAGELGLLQSDTPYTVCHQLAGSGTYRPLASLLWTCPDAPLYSLSPDTCVDGEAAVTVQVTKGSKTLSVNDKIAIVPGAATDCTDAETKCADLSACSTSAALTLAGENLHWAAGALASLPSNAPFKVCHQLAGSGAYRLLAGQFRTCCLGPVQAPYYVSLPWNTCVNDWKHLLHGSVMLFGTKAQCCAALTPKEQRECLKLEDLSEVYPSLEKGRCVSDTQRPAVLHPTCGVTAAGEIKFVAARFFKASLLVSDNELCCKRVYGGIDGAAVDRCVAKKGTWYYVDGMGLVRDDPLADDPVVYATARTVGSLSSCAQTYF